MTDPNLNRLLDSRYQLTHLIGKGAMGRVYRAQDVLLGGVPVAVKFLSQTLLNQKMRERFEREATTCAQLGRKSIHIILVTDYGVDENEIPFYVMEYLQGDSLNEIIRKRPLPLPRFLSVTRQIGLGLQCAHQGIPLDGKICPIIHRDIKPSNILVSQDASLGELVKVLDFGIAKLLQADGGQTNDGSFMGTLAYSSPEQMEGRELDSRSDIYSLGVMMFEMLTGKMPLQAETHTFGGWYKAHHFLPPHSLESVDPSLKLPKVLENLVMSCLAKQPGDRPQTMNEVLKVLEPLEQRFGVGRQIGQRIEVALSKLPVTANPKSQSVLSGDDICRLASWPQNKPIAEIVFPHSVRTSQEVLATLWIMLPKQEIQERRLSSRYNQFLCVMAPHPMLLWITALHNGEQTPRWLPCYLDLQTQQGQDMTRLLAQTGQYRLLFFGLEEPQRCANVLISTIAAGQCKLLREWANDSRMMQSAAQPAISKKLLKQEFEKLKPKIMLKLQSIHANAASDIVS